MYRYLNKLCIVLDLRFEVLTVVKISLLVFRILTHVALWMVTRILDEHAAFIFKVEPIMFERVQQLIHNSYMNILCF
jgi:hypothetical protein